MKGDDLKTKEARLRTYHRTIEAFKFAYAKRSELGDARKIDLSKVFYLKITLYCVDLNSTILVNVCVFN